MDRRELIDIIEDELGDIQDYVIDCQEDYQLEGFCTNCGYNVGTVEPDCNNSECPECGDYAVSSVLEILMG